jgi:hypothetical protein
MGLLSGDGAAARRLDPSGESSLNLAKRMRIDVLRARIAPDPQSLIRVADDHFALPNQPLPFWDTSGAQRPWQRGMSDVRSPLSEV